MGYGRRFLKKKEKEEKPAREKQTAEEIYGMPVGRVFAAAKTARNLPSQISGFAGALFRGRREITVETGSLRRRCLLGEN